MIPGGRWRPSLDHILPRVRGGRDLLHGDVRNTRLMCQDCNGLLAACGQCLGALAAVSSVAADVDVARKTIARRWRLAEIERAGRARRAGLVPDAEAARRRAALMAEVERIRLDEFVWPEDTPAKVVWNRLTLASRRRARG
ncbi:MAG TPA: hypothetical protein VMV33_17160 [Rhodocyclaceae bacterium]|nr:hypothetical protein [Rhodocyclaceae bacterium]